MKNLTFFDWLILICSNLFILFIAQFWIGMKKNDVPYSLFIHRFLFLSIIPILVSLFFFFIYRKKTFSKSLAFKIFTISMLSNLVGTLLFYISMTS
jgi:hypothetical protein